MQGTITSLKFLMFLYVMTCSNIFLPEKHSFVERKFVLANCAFEFCIFVKAFVWLLNLHIFLVFLVFLIPHK